jgi:transposase
MGKSRAPYPPEFRQQMIELVRSGRSPESLEKEFEPSAQTIRNWVKQADLDTGRRTDGLTSAEREELRLRDQIADAEFDKERSELERERLRLLAAVQRAQKRQSWFSPGQTVILFRDRAIPAFKRGGVDQRRFIAETVGSHPTLKDRKLSIDARKPFTVLPERPSSQQV